MAEKTLILNPEQRMAVEHEKGPLLIIAGAGTGKTTVITERVKWLLTKKDVKPSEILALTFTDKAARQMEERIDLALPYGYSQLWISTFHSFGDRVLRNEAIHIGLDPGYTLMTEAEAIMFLRRNLFAFELKYFRPLGNPTKFVASIFNHFSRLKDEDIEPKQYIAWAKSQISNLKSQANNLKNKNGEQEEIRKSLELAYAYQKYEELKAKEGVADFADLISNTLKLFRKRPNILRQYQEQFKHILVDEFQDTNYSQNQLAILLAGDRENITVCADDDQSIYRFRGAAVSNVIQFTSKFPKAKIVVLTKNYRSTQEILDKAYLLIRHNDPDRLEVKEKINKKLTSVRKRRGEKIEFIFTNRVENEAEEVVKRIKHLESKARNKKSEKKYRWKDFAILVRANNYADPFVRALARAGIPYQFLGPGMLFRQNEIKDLIAYLRFLSNLTDSVSFYRVLAMEHFSLSQRDLAAIISFAKKVHLSLFDAVEVIVSLFDQSIEREDKENYRAYLPFISKRTKETLAKIVKMINRHLKLVPKETAGQILYYFLEDAGILAKFANYQTVKEEREIANIARFFDKLKTFEVEHEDARIHTVVDWIDMRMELGESPLAADIDWSENEAVTILTAHSAKGLEFPVVFMVNLVEGRFPSRERQEPIPIPEALIKEILPSEDYHLEEERRLFYVGMTRTMDRLFLSASLYYGEAKRERKVSPFVYEALGEEEVAKQLGKDQTGNQLFLFDWQKSKEEPKAETSLLKRPVTYLSYSQIETFRFCPLHYKARYILRIPTPPYAAQSFGQTIHTTLKRFYTGIIQGEKWGLDKLLALYEEAWIPLGYEGKSHQKAMKERGKEQLASFFRLFHQQEPIPKAVEQPFVFPLTSKLKVGGVIDRIHKTEDGKIEIVDYKTATKVPSQAQVNRDRQLTIYALAATEVKDPFLAKEVEDVILSLYFLGSQKKITTIRTTKQLEQAKKDIIGIARQIEQSDFSCSGVTWCKKCEYKMLCSPNT